MEAIEERVGDIPERTVTLDRIAGMEASKRALEVALAGGHAIVFVYNSNSDAPQLIHAGKRIAEDHGLAFHGLAYPACKCGNYAAKTSECKCRPVSMRNHLARLTRRRTEFDIWMDACCVRPASKQVSPGEKEQVIVDRILAARTIRDISGPDSEGRQLLTAYQTHIGKPIDEDRILRVATTIARLEDSGRSLKAHHVAEAIQYQPTSHRWIWEWTGLEQLELTTDIRLRSNDGRTTA